MKKLLIYGATGYTGRMAATRAKEMGLDMVIAGRNESKLSELASGWEVEHRVLALDDPGAIKKALNEVSVLLNFAGPFAQTAEPLMRACIEAGVHYLDITAEINVYRRADRLDQQARDAGVMLMPGVGWDVVPTDCLAVYLAGQVDNPRSLRIALQVAGSMSRGSAISVGEIIGAGLMVRKNGELIATPEAEPELFDFGEGPVLCAPLSFGDLVTAWHSTAIPNISMFVQITGEAFPEGDLTQLPDGPTREQREAHPARAVAEVIGADGVIASARIDTVNGYSYTPLSAIEAARRVLTGEHRPGFQTPAKLFGTGFAKSIDGTSITEIRRMEV
jgi:short subunit dehydrogenase-like uncharacterized protein